MGLGVAFDDVLSAAQAGAPWAMTRLYETYAGAVAGYFRGQRVDDPEDLTSETMLCALERLGSFRGGEAEFRSWLFTIAHHRYVDFVRRATRRRERERLGPIPDVPHGDVEDEAMAALGTRRVVEILDRLVPDQRAVLLLRLVGDLTVEQVAEVLGKSAGAVKQLQRRGLAAVDRMMAAEGVTL